jgi:ATP-dependent HslUV protease ATP-binding subunit HslU
MILRSFASNRALHHRLQGEKFTLIRLLTSQEIPTAPSPPDTLPIDLSDSPPSSPASSSSSSSSSSSPAENEETISSYNLKRNETYRPRDIVQELDRHIVGQADAKRAIAIALRNRWRRLQLDPEFRREVTPRNVLMVGPTGCGKTEIARRTAALEDSPFIKVEATKFTEVGYHGRDVDQIIKDLMEVSIQTTAKKYRRELKSQAEALVEERLLDILVGPSDGSRGRNSFREMLRNGQLDDQLVEIEVPDPKDEDTPGSRDLPPNMPDLSRFISAMKGKRRSERKKLPISEARPIVFQSEIGKLLDNIEIVKESILAAEEKGIVVIDEIDKICQPSNTRRHGSDASDEGVQRDLLPIIEGTTISTKYGDVRTDYILFVTCGAFHNSKPNDLLPELQGRLPIRVELKGLTEGDLYRILTEPVFNVSYISGFGIFLTYSFPTFYHYFNCVRLTLPFSWFGNKLSLSERRV